MDRRTLLVTASALFAGSAIAAPAGGKPIVVGQTFEIQSSVLNEPRRLNVWLPAGYREDGPRLPVLYLLDGGVDEDFHHIAGLANISSAYGVTREFIVVGIESGSRRRYHMTWPSLDADDLKAIPHNGGAAEYRLFLVSDVIAWVEANFHVSSERVLMGESLGGLFAVDTLLRQPDMFTGYIAIDPSLWWNKGALVQQRDLPGWRVRTPRRKVFLALSSEGPKAEMEHLVEGLGGGADLTSRPMPEETHASIYHPAATTALRILFAPAAKP